MCQVSLGFNLDFGHKNNLVFTVSFFQSSFEDALRQRMTFLGMTLQRNRLAILTISMLYFKMTILIQMLAKPKKDNMTSVKTMIKETQKKNTQVMMTTVQMLVKMYKSMMFQIIKKTLIRPPMKKTKMVLDLVRALKTQSLDTILNWRLIQIIVQILVNLKLNTTVMMSQITKKTRIKQSAKKTKMDQDQVMTLKIPSLDATLNWRLIQIIAQILVNLKVNTSVILSKALTKKTPMVQDLDWTMQILNTIQTPMKT